MNDTRAMTYADLAAALGIGVESAKNLARRKRWERRTGNDGLARVIVPIETLTSRKAHPPINPPADRGADGASNPPADTPIAIAVLARHIERLEGELAKVTAERDQARAVAAQVDALRATLAAVEGERDRWHKAATAPRGLARFFMR